MVRKGQKLTSEQIIKNSNSHKGIFPSLQTRKKMSETHKNLYRLGIQIPSLRGVLNPPNKRLDIDKQREKIINYYASGFSIYLISKLFNCSSYVITRILKENKIKIVSPIEYVRGTKAWNKNLTGIYSNNTLNKIRLARAKQILPVKDSSIELKIQNYLKQLGYEFFTHQYIKEIEHGYQCDILIPAMNLVIECDGDYWHAYPIGREIDHVRTSELLEKGFKVLRLWECEINKMTIEDFKMKLNVQQREVK